MSTARRQSGSGRETIRGVTPRAVAFARFDLPLTLWEGCLMLGRLLATSIIVATVIFHATIVPAQESSGKTASPPGDEPQSTGSPTTTKAAPTPATSVPRSPGSPDDTATPAAGSKRKLERATFGGGCFWHVEAEFQALPGVKEAVSGYAGGNVPSPSYEMVHSGLTGHAEVVMVEFDPSVISYEKILKVFWSIHDPTSINRQGEDEGPQYRSVIFYHNDDQRLAALKSYRALTAAGVFGRPIVTQLMPLKAFYRAEDYHQDYYGGMARASARRKHAATTKTKKSGTKAARTARPARTEPAAGLPEVPASAKDPFAAAAESPRQF
jgi:peptide-methionine (S)-S-oxide reductase